MNKKNLLLLADFLDKLPQELFNMKYYRLNENGERVEFYSKNDCGTIGCALGWAAASGIPELEIEHFPKKGTRLSWLMYSEAVFGFISENTFDYLFSEYWTEVDNSPSGAAKRIRQVVNFGVPEGWTVKNIIQY